MVERKEADPRGGGFTEWVMNVPGILLECRDGSFFFFFFVFEAFSSTGGRCGLEGNHSLLIPAVVYFLLDNTQLTAPRTHIAVEHCHRYNHQGRHGGQGGSEI